MININNFSNNHVKSMLLDNVVRKTEHKNCDTLNVIIDENDIEYYINDKLVNDIHRLFSKPLNDAISIIESNIDEIYNLYSLLSFNLEESRLSLNDAIMADGKVVCEAQKLNDIADSLGIAFDCINENSSLEYLSKIGDRYVKFIDEASEDTERHQIDESTQKVLDIFENWVEVHEVALDDDLTTIESLFLEMTKDPKLYNQLMCIIPLCESSNGPHKMQYDRIMSDTLRNNVRRRGSNYEALFEKFVKYCYSINEEANKKYNQETDSISELLKKLQYPENIQPAITEFINAVFGNDPKLFTYSDNSKVFNIPRMYYNKVKDASSNYKNKEIKNDDSNGTLYCTIEFEPTDEYSSGNLYYSISGKDNSIKNTKKRFAKMGNGSLAKVSTEDQEAATCDVWNHIARMQTLSGKSGSLSQKLSKEQIEMIFPDSVKNNSTFNKSWLASFKNQIFAIQEFLTTVKGIKNIWEYRAIRYGVDDNNVAQAHKEFLKKYIDVVKTTYETPQLGLNRRISKDNYDPSDILLYKVTPQISKNRDNSVNDATDDTKDIEQYLQNLKNINSENYKLADMFNMYLEGYLKNLMIGISLKKSMSIGKFEEFNCGEYTNNGTEFSCSIESSSLKNSVNSRGAQANVVGNFNFKGVSDPENPEMNVKKRNLKVTIRTFGNNTVGIDVAEANGSALGKSPKESWKNLLDKFATEEEKKHPINDELKYYRPIFERVFNLEAINNSDPIKPEYIKAQTAIISNAVKNGPWCLPFVLIH